MGLTFVFNGMSSSGWFGYMFWFARGPLLGCFVISSVFTSGDRITSVRPFAVRRRLSISLYGIFLKLSMSAAQGRRRKSYPVLDRVLF